MRFCGEFQRTIRFSTCPVSSDPSPRTSSAASVSANSVRKSSLSHRKMRGGSKECRGWIESAIRSESELRRRHRSPPCSRFWGVRSTNPESRILAANRLSVAQSISYRAGSKGATSSIRRRYQGGRAATCSSEQVTRASHSLHRSVGRCIATRPHPPLAEAGRPDPRRHTLHDRLDRWRPRARRMVLLAVAA